MFGMDRKVSPFAWFALPVAVIPEVAYAVFPPNAEPLYAICYASAGLFALLWVLRHVTFVRPDKRSADITFSFKARGTGARIMAAGLFFTQMLVMLSFSDVRQPALYSKFDLIPCGITAFLLWSFLMDVPVPWNRSTALS